MRPSSRDGTTFTRRQKRVAPSKSGSRRLSVKRNTSRSYGNPMRNWKIEITKKRLARRKKNRAIDEQKPAGEKVPDPVDGRPWSDTHTHTHTVAHTQNPTSSGLDGLFIWLDLALAEPCLRLRCTSGFSRRFATFHCVCLIARSCLMDSACVSISWSLL